MTTPKTPHTAALLAIDIEHGGESLTHPLVAVGTCLAHDTMDGRIIERRRFVHLGADPADFEERRRTQFWDRHPTLLDRLKQSSQTCVVETFETEAGVVVAFYNYLRTLERRLRDPDDPKGGYEAFDYRIVTDNASYDIGRLDALLARHYQKPGLAYQPSMDEHGRRRPIIDIWELMRGYNGRDFMANDGVGMSTFVADNAPHYDRARMCNHMPESDAEYMVRVAQTYLAQVRKNSGPKRR